MLIKLEEMDEKIMPNEMKFLMKSITYLPWPKSKSDEKEFWHKLKVSLAKKNSTYANISFLE